MGRDEILNMPAGREMDALIAEKVMGLWTGPLTPLETEVALAHGMIFSYSWDIAGAWQVVEKMVTNGWRFYCASMDIGTFVDAPIRAAEFQKGDVTGPYVKNKSETIPLAICKSALIAVLDI